MLISISILGSTLLASAASIFLGRLEAKKLENMKYESLVLKIYRKVDSISQDDNVSSSELAKILPYSTEVLFMIADENNDGLQYEELKEIIHDMKLAQQIWSMIGNISD